MVFDGYFARKGEGMSLRNLISDFDKSMSIVDITDAIEDSKTAEELMNNLNALKLETPPFEIDRVTDKYVRLSSMSYGNGKTYLKCLYD